MAEIIFKCRNKWLQKHFYSDLQGDNVKFPWVSFYVVEKVSQTPYTAKETVLSKLCGVNLHYDDTCHKRLQL